MRLIPPEQGWQAALVAADAVIGDHGSVTYYAAALGRPVLLAAFDEGEVLPGSHIDLLGRAAPGWTRAPRCSPRSAPRWTGTPRPGANGSPRS
ncbi:hypothetical protein ACFQXA_03960 [Nocardiopsis composta]